MNLHDIDPGTSSEQATVITFGMLVLGKITEYSTLQDVSYTMAIILTACTLFINRTKYLEEFKKTNFYKWIKNGFKKNNRRTP